MEKVKDGGKTEKQLVTDRVKVKENNGIRREKEKKEYKNEKEKQKGKGKSKLDRTFNFVPQKKKKLF